MGNWINDRNWIIYVPEVRSQNHAMPMPRTFHALFCDAFVSSPSPPLSPPSIRASNSTLPDLLAAETCYDCHVLLTVTAVAPVAGTVYV
jgi:hypothetical protein